MKKLDTPEYRSWCSMHQRCKHTYRERYYYFDRGIAVHPSWNSFEVFLKDMGPKPGLQYILERRNNDEGYYKENCCWATAKEQANNRRSTNKVMFKGKTASITEWASYFGISQQTMHHRVCKRGGKLRENYEEIMTIMQQQKKP